MHQAAFDFHGLPWRYQLQESAPNQFVQDWRRIVAGGLAGANLTVPHKVSVLELLDEIDPDARTIGAVNTVVCNHGRTTGYNTDVQGVLGPLQEASFDLQNRPVVILGAGGAARAVVAAAARSTCASLTLITRRPEAGVELLATVAPGFSGKSRALPWSALSIGPQMCPEHALLVNATTVGMECGDSTPVSAERLPSAGLVFDCVYGASPRRLIRESEQQRIPAIDGSQMLLHQGMQAFTLWTDKEAPADVMRAALAPQR